MINITKLSELKDNLVFLDYSIFKKEVELKKTYYIGNDPNNPTPEAEQIKKFNGNYLAMFDTKAEALEFVAQKKFEKRIKELGKSGELAVVIDGCKTFLNQIINSYEAHDSIVDTKDHETQLLFSAFLIENAKFGIDNDDKTIIHGIGKDLSDKFKSMLLFVKEHETHATLFTDMEANIRAMCVGCKFIAQDSDKNTIDIISDVFNSQKYLGGK